MKTRISPKVNALREVQSASREELSALMTSILDKAFGDGTILFGAHCLEPLEPREKAGFSGRYNF
jgi:hypothetical protein